MVWGRGGGQGALIINFVCECISNDVMPEFLPRILSKIVVMISTSQELINFRKEHFVFAFLRR